MPVILHYTVVLPRRRKYIDPGKKTDIEEIIESVAEKEKRKKLVNLIVVAEGDEFGGAELVKTHQRKLAITGNAGLYFGAYSKRWVP